MKILILPGVGFHTDIMPPVRLIKEIKKQLKCELEWYNWKHNLSVPQLDLGHSTLRPLLAEIILDFQAVVRDVATIPLPDADYYIGHSAGSIIALFQSKRNAIIFGSPALLVENITGDKRDPIDIFTQDRKIFNIVNKQDIISYPLPLLNVENHYVDKWWINPFAAHTCYWDDKQIVQLMIDKIKKWENDKTSEISSPDNLQI